MKKPGTRGIYLASVPFVSVVINLSFLAALFVATREMKAPPWQVGLLGACMIGVYALLCPILGWLIGRADPRPKAVVVCMMYVVIGLTVPHVRAFWPLLFLILLLGLAGAIYWPMIEGVICAGRTRTQIRRALGTFNVLWCCGAMIGMLLAGVLYDWHRSLPFWVAACVALVPMAMFALAPSPHGRQGARGEVNNAAAEEEEIPRELATAFLYLARVLVFLAYFTFSSLRTLFPKHGEQMGFSATTISALLFVVVLAQAATFLLMRNTGFWHYRFWPLLLGAGAAAASFLVVGSVRTPVALILPFVCIGFFAGCSYFSSIYYAMSRPRAGVESAAWHESTLGMGSALGPLAGGLLAQQTGSMSVSFTLCAVVAMIGFGIPAQFLLRRLTRPERRSAEDEKLQ